LLGPNSLAKDNNAIHHQREVFTAIGDAQTSQIVYFGSDQTAGQLYSDGASQRITVTANRYIAAEGQVLIVNTNTNDTSQFQIFGCYKNTGGGAVLVGAPTSIAIAEDIAGLHTAKFQLSGAGEIEVACTDSSPLPSDQVFRAIAYIRYTELVI